MATVSCLLQIRKCCCDFHDFTFHYCGVLYARHIKGDIVLIDILA